MAVLSIKLEQDLDTRLADAKAPLEEYGRQVGALLGDLQARMNGAMTIVNRALEGRRAFTRAEAVNIAKEASQAQELTRKLIPIMHPGFSDAAAEFARRLVRDPALCALLAADAANGG